MDEAEALTAMRQAVNKLKGLADEYIVENRKVHELQIQKDEVVKFSEEFILRITQVLDELEQHQCHLATIHKGESKNKDSKQSKDDKELIEKLNREIHQLTTERDIIKEKYEELQTENETLRSSLKAATREASKESPEHEDDIRHLLDDSETFIVPEELETLPSDAHCKIIKILARKVKKMERQSKAQPTKTLEKGQENSKSNGETKSIDPRNLEKIRLEESIIMKKHQCNLEEAHRKIQAMKPLERELKESEKKSWKFEWQAKELEFENSTLLDDVVIMMKLIRKFFTAAQPLAQEFRQGIKNVELTVEFFDIVEEIGCFIKVAKSYDQILQEKKKTKEANAASESCDNEKRQKHQFSRYRRLYLHLKREYDYLDSFNQDLLERYNSIKSDLTRAIFMPLSSATSSKMKQEQPGVAGCPKKLTKRRRAMRSIDYSNKSDEALEDEPSRPRRPKDDIEISGEGNPTPDNKSEM